MLKGISPLLSPELLKLLCAMGHGDYIVFADAHFPAYSIGPQVLHTDVQSVTEMLAAVAPLWELDPYVDAPLVMMTPVPGDHLDVDLAHEVARIMGHETSYMERFAFYEKAKKAFAIVQTGELRTYGNVIIQKGIIHP